MVAGNYARQRDISWTKAEVVVWLDLALPVIVYRVLKRTYQRYRNQTLLWGTHREHLSSLLKVWNPEQSLLAWALLQQRRLRRGCSALSRAPQWQHLRFVRLRSSEEVRVWLLQECEQRS